MFECVVMFISVFIHNGVRPHLHLALHLLPEISNRISFSVVYVCVQEIEIECCLLRGGIGICGIVEGCGFLCIVVMV